MTLHDVVFFFIAFCCAVNATPVNSEESKGAEFKKRFYIDTSQRLNWHGAYFKCVRNGGLLANIETADEYEEVNNLMQNSAVKESFWLGGNDLAFDGAWQWSQGQDMGEHTNWSENEPNSNGNGNENCLLAVKEWGYRWNDAPCTNAFHYFICEQKTAIKTRSDWPPVDAGKKKFYLGLNMKVDWHSAYMQCLTNNSRLARIENKEENQIVVNMIKEANIGYDLEYWLGAMDYPEVGLYFWLATGQPVKEYSNWHAGQGMAEDQRCLTYWQSSKNIVRWNDYVCSTLYNYVCEYYD